MDGGSSTQSARPFAPVYRVLQQVQILGEELDHVHAGLKAQMGMNTHDLTTLRLLVIREQQGIPVKAGQVAAHLGISTASVTVLLDRLAAAGHITRRPDPRDRRARVIELTDHARAEFFRSFSGHLGAMKEAASDFDDAELGTVARFLEALNAALRASFNGSPAEDAPCASTSALPTPVIGTPESETGSSRQTPEPPRHS